MKRIVSLQEYLDDFRKDEIHQQTFPFFTTTFLFLL
uniref:Uncharacterized protein n=1 Tax=Jakoba libera TaxID=143017 RepID=M4QCD0_JAKLI|nr:hypothetical protein L048_p042 [Jakoba libera]AGH24214.1 hypothetical protein [Jakoba libera]